MIQAGIKDVGSFGADKEVCIGNFEIHWDRDKSYWKTDHIREDCVEEYLLVRNTQHKRRGGSHRCSRNCRAGNQSFSVYFNFPVLEILTLGGQEASVPVC
jgi:hypothetical protein